MLHQVLMTLRSDYPRNVFYQVFQPGDTAFLFSLDGKEGWLNAGQGEMEIWVNADFPRVKVGFREKASAMSDWIAEPVEVSAAKRIALNNLGKIVEEESEEGYDPTRLSEATFFTGDIFRALLNGLGSIPKAGIALQLLFDRIWPEPSAQSLVAAMERRMRWLIRASVNRLDLANQTAFLNAARENLRQYVNAAGPRQRFAALTQALGHFTVTKELMTNSVKSYAPGTAHLVLQLAVLHLALLRERVVFEKEIFGDEPVNSAENRRDLTRAIAEYRTFLLGAIDQELAERDRQMELAFAIGFEVIDVHTQVDLTNGLLTDEARRRIHRFSVEGAFNVTVEQEPGKLGDPIRFMAEIYRRQMKNALRLQLRLDIEIPAQLLATFDPDFQGNKILDYEQLVQGGPLSGIPQMRFLASNMQGGTLQTHAPGRIRRVRVLSMVGGLSLIPVLTVEGKDGKQRDSLEGVSPNSPFFVYDRKLPANVTLNRIETSWDTYLKGLKFSFSDGSESPRIGTFADTHHKQVAELPGHYVSQIELDNGLMNVGFQLHPDFVERLE